MNDVINKNPFLSHLITIFICILLIILAFVIYHHIAFTIPTNIVNDTNFRIKNIEKHALPDSLIYYENER